MKKILFAAMAATVLFASCAKDNNNGGDAPEGKKATLNVSVTAPVPSRAAAATVPADAVGNFTVFITDNTDEIKWSAFSSTGANLTGADAVEVSTNAKHVYVVANAGNLTGTITTKALLDSYIADLNGTGSQTSARWATGNTASALTFVQNGNDFVATPPAISLTFIAARITVSVVNNMSNYGGTGSLTLNSIAVLNARGESKLFGTSLIPAAYTTGKKFYMGYDQPGGVTFANWPAAADYTLATSLLSDVLTDLDNDTYYYYVFENDADAATELPTIVTLIGEDADGEALYWPVHLAPYEEWEAGSGSVSSIERGKSYNITITLTGDATNGGGGSTDPTDPVVTAVVNVSVSLTDWVPVTLNKEF